MRRRSVLLLGAGVACRKAVDMNSIAERYVKLVLALGTHDPDYVDAYYGPPAWKTEAATRKLSLDQIRAEGEAILGAFEIEMPDPEDLRYQYLLVQTKSVIARAGMMAGRQLTFDQESRELYDAVAPAVGPVQFEQTLSGLEQLLPGTGPLAERYEAWRKQFYIPAARMPVVFKAAIEEARARTKRHMNLPENENFVVEYVTKQVWSAYNWYKGDAQSLIQVNTDFPTEAKFVLHLACHEGYPGHHVYNALLEHRLVRKRGWIEYTVYPLYSPQSLIAEGSADYGVGLAFPGEQRAEFLASRIFPLAGLDPRQVPAYLKVGQLVEDLDHVVNYAARRYVDKEISREECQKLLEKYALSSPERAGQRVRFIEKNRSYVINYNVGEDLIRDYMKRRGETWREMEILLSSPRLPSGLRV